MSGCRCVNEARGLDMLAVSHHKSASEAMSMGDPTSLLFGLDEFTVVGVVCVAEQLVEVVIEPLPTWFRRWRS